MMQLRVIRSWPGVTNGQIISTDPIRGKRLIAHKLAKVYRKPGRKKNVNES